MKSDAEAALKFQLQAVGIIGRHGIAEEVAFALPRKWRFDFAWIDRKLAVEVEGGTWIGGRHNRGSWAEREMEKYNEAALRGWTVIRVTPAMIDDGRAIELIERALTR